MKPNPYTYFLFVFLVFFAAAAGCEEGTTPLATDADADGYWMAVGR